MVNTGDFSKRLQKVIEHYGESASSFAVKIGVQRSSISHILSGRNKPSLDFVLKILSTYPEVELYWLLNGKGDFLGEATHRTAPENKPPVKVPEVTIQETMASYNKQIKKIVVFYSDGTFEEYTKG